MATSSGRYPVIIVAGKLRIRAGRRQEFLDLSLPAMIAARRAPGCIDFVVAADPVEADRVNIHEAWESEEALLAFREGGPSANIASLIETATVTRHAVASSGPA